MTIIIDCDPGLDDAIALWMALANDDLDIALVTTCSGNQVGDTTFRNARNIVSMSRRADLPVVQGATKPIVGPEVIADYVHGDDGVGGVPLPTSTAPRDTRRAWEAMRDVIEAAKEPAVIAATGPLTNVAIFLLAYPDLHDRIERIVWMGGSVGTGNHSAAAEFNAFVDPHAADIVFRSGVLVEMFGLNVTMQAQVMPEEVDAIAALGTDIASAAAGMLRFYQTTMSQPLLAEPGHVEGVHLHDPCVIAYLLAPELFTMLPAQVSVVTAECAALGATIADFSAEPNCRVAVRVNREQFVDLVHSRLGGTDK